MLQSRGQLAEAEAHYRKALSIKPDYLEALNNMGTFFLDQGRLAEAERYYDEAIRRQPDCATAHWNRALAWLKGGDFTRGWQEFEWRWQLQRYPPRQLSQPPWDGSPLDGRTILLHAEMGFGDALQFVRYVPLVKERGGTVIVECDPVLTALLATCKGVDTVVAKDSPLPPFDVHAPFFRLPTLLGTTLASIPAGVPYLFPDPQKVRWWSAALDKETRRQGYKETRGQGDKETSEAQVTTPPPHHPTTSPSHHSPLTTHHSPLKIGIAWQGNPTGDKDRERSIPLAQFAPIAELDGVQLFSLQKGAGSEQIAQVADRFTVTDLGSRFDTFMDTAAVVKLLDLVITVDSAVAHCAGALGVPVWVAIPSTSCWRWLLDREDTPWYPTMRLFRQKHWGEWNEVFERIASEVLKLKQNLGTTGVSFNPEPTATANIG